MRIVNNFKSNAGQSLVEFLLTVPIFFLIFFVFTQFANILDGCQKSQMSLWCGIRAASLPSQIFVGKSVLQPWYRTSDVINWVHTDVFSQNDTVDISIDRGSWPAVLNTVDMKVNIYVPYLYAGIAWPALDYVFKGRLVYRGGKPYFLMRYEGQMDCFSPVLPT